MARVLVVEDDPDTMALFERWLGADGHDVTGASTGVEGLSALVGPAFDLLLVDIRLPDMSGYQLVQRARAEGLSQARVAVATVTDADDAPRDLPLDAWLPKPFTRAELQAALETALGTT